MKKEKAKVENKNTIEKENITNETDETVEQKMAKKKVPKQVSQEILKKIFKNLILAIVVMLYFISCNIIYTQVEWNQMELITQSISGAFLLASLISFEFAYKRDSGTLTMTAIELLVLAIHALFIDHVVTIYQFNFRTYLITSSCIFVIYYALKSTVIYTRARMKYLKSLSDISEIVKDEPVIKEAKKRKEEPVVDNSEEIKEEKEKDIIKKKQTTKKKNKEIDKKEKEEIKQINQEEQEEAKTQKVSKTKTKRKQNKEDKHEETKVEQQNEKQEEKESKKEEKIDEVKKRPKSKRGRKKKEGDQS